MLSNGLAENLPNITIIGVTIGLTLVLAIISVIDLRTLRIPDLLSLPLIATGLILAFIVPKADATEHLIGAAGAFALFAGLGEFYYRKRGLDGLGLGDAKLFAAAGAWLGWQNLPLVLLIATTGGLAQALFMQSFQRDKQLAFGPWIALGFWTVWIWICWHGYTG